MELSITTTPAPPPKVRGRSLPVFGLVLGAAAVPPAFVPEYEQHVAALGLAGTAVLVSSAALARALSGLRRGRDIAIVGVVLGLVSAGGVLVSPASHDRMPASAPQIPTAVAPRADDLDVKVGTFTSPGKGARPSVTLTVTNRGLQPRSFDLTVEAVSARGVRLSTDTVSASSLAPGATVRVPAFGAAPDSLLGELARAKFRLVETARF